QDTVYLQKVGDPNAPTIALGTFRYDGPLGPGVSYTLREQVLLPARTYGLYEAVVTTNFDDHLYEVDGQNNTRVAAVSTPIAIKPRPDLQVGDITAPTQADPGQSIAVEFNIVNQGNVTTSVPNWTDRVYLSLDPVRHAG